MRVSTNSMFIAALASSTSLSRLVGAAPAAHSANDNAMTTTSEAAPAPEAVGPGAPDLSSILGALPTSSTRRALLTTESLSLDARQPGSLLDSLTGVVKTVLSLLGLSTSSAAGTESIDSQLSPDQISHITELVKNMTGDAPLSLPVPALVSAPSSSSRPGNKTGSTAPQGNNTSPSTRTSQSGEVVSRRSKPDWEDHPTGGPPSLPLFSVGAAGLPVDSPFPAGSNDSNSSSSPSPPAGTPYAPIDIPSPPVGGSPFSPSLPLIPPNSPVQAASEPVEPLNAPLPVISA